MSLMLNCQWIKCVGDIINKYNNVIDFIVILFLIAFAFCIAKKKTTGIKPFILVCTNFIALIFSIAALCMTHPNQLGFDYIGAIVGILALLVTVLIGWNIYQLVDVKGIRKDFEELKKSCKSDIDKLKKMQSIIDVRGGNKDKCAIICYKSHKENSTINDEIEKFYKSLGMEVSLVTMRLDGENKYIFFNGGLNDVYTEYLKTMLTSKFDLDSIDISYKSIEEIGVMSGILVK